MILDLIDKRIRRAFSNAAMQYDALSGLHKEIGRELVKKVSGQENCERILEVGTGTGYFTNKLKSFFPGATVVGLDFARGMIEAASQNNEEGYHLLQADASALPFRRESFDLVASNLAYQWVRDLAGAWGRCHEILKPGGSFAATLFGYHTLDELFVALKEARADGERSLAVRRLADRSQIEEALRQAGFKNSQVSTERIKVRFPDMMGLIRWTKEIGANGLDRDFFVGKELLARANEYYEKNFRDRLGIYTTFEVIWVIARKN